MQLKHALMAELLTNDGFRESLIATPQAAIDNFLRRNPEFTPAGSTTFHVVVETERQAYFVVPPDAADDPAAWFGLEGTALGKAFADPVFLDAVDADPAAAIEERFGVTIPDGLAVDAVYEAVNERYLVVPFDRSGFAEPGVTDTILAYHTAAYCGFSVIRFPRPGEPRTINEPRCDLHSWDPAFCHPRTIPF